MLIPLPPPLIQTASPKSHGQQRATTRNRPFPFPGIPHRVLPIGPPLEEEPDLEDEE